MNPAYSPNVYNPVASDVRTPTRTPSPTPSEISALNQKSMLNYKAMFQKDKLFTKQYLIYYAIGLVVIVIGALSIFYHDQIVHAVQPAVRWMHGLPFGWLIPIAIFFIISFPPLFGHEILAILCGLVWGLWPGFGITAAGTLVGEIGNFYAFRYLFHARAEKEEKKSIQYAALSKVVREGGFKIAIIVRYSAVPGHFTTAIFAVCGMNIIVFIIAAILSMPKQFFTVYLGTLLENSSNGTATNQNRMLSYVVGAITVVVTVAAMWYIQREVNRVKPEIVYARRKARQAKLTGDGLYQNGGVAGSTDDAVFNPNASDVTLDTPVPRSDAPYDSHYQQWGRDGRAVGYASDPRVFAPQPRRASASFDPALGVPSRTGSAAGAGLPRQESTDTMRWELQTNTADGQAYPLHAIPEPEPHQPLSNPFDNASSETVTPPSGPPPARSSAGDYAFSAPQHSFEGNSGNQSTRTYSPPPPSYRV